MKPKLLITIGIVVVVGFVGVTLVSMLSSKSQPTSDAIVIDKKELAKREAEDAKEDAKNAPKPPAIEVPVEEEPEISTMDAIKQAFSDKYTKPLSEINVVISQETATHAKGGVSFGAGGPGEGGLFLATKMGESWVIVFDGNGSVACADLAPYNFPPEMIGEVCY